MKETRKKYPNSVEKRSIGLFGRRIVISEQNKKTGKLETMDEFTFFPPFTTEEEWHGGMDNEMCQDWLRWWETDRLWILQLAGRELTRKYCDAEQMGKNEVRP